MDWGVDGKVVLVTGAAAGIGAEIVRQFADAGARVYGADKDWTSTTETRAVTTLTLDVSDRAAVHDAVGRVAEDAAGLDIVVNNAGTMRARDSIFDYDESDWNSTLAVNTSGLFYCLQAAAKIMRERASGGSIVNVASGAGRTGRTFSPPYAASKAAVINITRSSALVLAPDAIRVNAVAPGLIDTEFNRRLGVQFGESLGLTPQEHLMKRAEPVPLGRVGTAADVARVICFLASPFASYVTGQTVNVDGGLVLS
jgi:NAD(P)-dependent dehydrogenase (short-subunit alcohol dehydrogenase family)